jgi:Ca2+/H+ antiporter
MDYKLLLCTAAILVPGAYLLSEPDVRWLGMIGYCIVISVIAFISFLYFYIPKKI